MRTEHEEVFNEIEKRAEAVRKLRTLPDVDYIVALTFTENAVYVVTGNGKRGEYCTQCGTPRGDRTPISVSIDDLRAAIGRVIGDRRAALTAIALGHGDDPLTPDPIAPEPSCPVYAPLEPVRYGRANIPEPALGQRVIGDNPLRGDPLRGEWRIYSVLDGDVYLHREGAPDQIIAIACYRQWVIKVYTEDGGLLWELEDIPF